MLEVTRIRHAWPEKAGFTIDRKQGYPEYTFLHFFNSVELLVDGKMVKTRPHACIMYNIHTPQRIVSTQPLTHDWIHFRGDLDDVFLVFGLEYDKLYYPTKADFITRIVQEMEYERYSSKRYGEELINAKTAELFINLFRSCANELSPGVDSSTNDRFRNLRSEMFQNLGRQWTVEGMAKSVGLSKSRFYTIYRRIYGNSPTDDLIRARIDSAQNLLLFGDASVSRIAEELGYNNLTHFMRQFKMLTGTSPEKFRKAGR